MNKKHYVIWKGKQTGVFDTWSKVQPLVAGLKNAQYMGFPSKDEAEQAFKESYTKALMKRSLSEGNGTNKKRSKILEPANSPKVQNNKQPLNFADFNIYCDGACSPNPGKSGSGIAIYHKEQLIQLWYGLYDTNGTNNTAELLALREALKISISHIEKNCSVQILSDSKYSIDCITKWAKGWKSKGWTRGKGEEIKNLEIIKECFFIYEKLKAHLTITHVKGHANIEGNELSDRMAVFARVQAKNEFVEYKKPLDISAILAMQSG